MDKWEYMLENITWGKDEYGDYWTADFERGKIGNFYDLPRGTKREQIKKIEAEEKGLKLCYLCGKEVVLLEAANFHVHKEYSDHNVDRRQEI